MYCHRCGNEAPEKALFCPACGTKLVQPSAQTGLDEETIANETAAEEALWGSGESESRGTAEAVEEVATVASVGAQSGGETTVVDVQETAQVPRSDATVAGERVESYAKTEVYTTPVPGPEPRVEPQSQPSTRPQTQAPPPDPTRDYQRQSYRQPTSTPPMVAPLRNGFPRSTGSIAVAVLAIVLIVVSLLPWVALPDTISQLMGGATQYLNDLDLGNVGGNLNGNLNGLGLDLDFNLDDLGINLGGLGLGAMNLAGGFAPWSMYGLASLLDTITQDAVMVPGSVAIVACWVAAVICLVIGIIGCLMPRGSGFARASSLVPIGCAIMAVDALGTWLYAIYADGITGAILGNWLGGLAQDFSNSLELDSSLGDALFGNGAISLNISLLNVTFWLWIALVLAAVTFVLGIAFRRRANEV